MRQIREHLAVISSWPILTHVLVCLFFSFRLSPKPQRELLFNVLCVVVVAVIWAVCVVLEFRRSRSRREHRLPYNINVESHAHYIAIAHSEAVQSLLPRTFVLRPTKPNRHLKGRHQIGRIELSSDIHTIQEARTIMSADPVPFEVNFKSDDIEDLRRRLKAARWPDELEDEQWQYGTDKTYLKELAEYWRSTFSFEKIKNY
eukprot:jgi/Botrbrau1/21953/Bobra.0249s0076.1